MQSLRVVGLLLMLRAEDLKRLATISLIFVVGKLRAPSNLTVQYVLMLQKGKHELLKIFQFFSAFERLPGVPT